MYTIAKICLIIILELNIYHCIGHALKQLRLFPGDRIFGSSLAYGFLVYHFLFWCLAFPCSLRDVSLTRTTACWVLILCLLLAALIIACRKTLPDSYRRAFAFFWQYKFWFLPCFLLVAFFIYYVCNNGQIDTDAQTYIGEVTSMVATDRLAGIDVTTGYVTDRLNMHRAGAMFGVNSAVLCRIFRIHPLIFCRTVRAALNFIFLSVVLFMLLRKALHRDPDAVKKSVMILMLTECTLLLFTNSQLTSSSFVLFRAYEGKALCSQALVLLAIYLAVCFCMTEDWRFFPVLFILMMASMSLSASAVFVIPIAAGSIILAYCLAMRRWKYLSGLALSVLPNIIYTLLIITGFAGFQLGGT